MRTIALIWLVLLFGSVVVFAQQSATPTPTVMPGQTAYPLGYKGQLTPTPTPTYVPSNWPPPTVTPTPTPSGAIKK